MKKRRARAKPARAAKRTGAKPAKRVTRIVKKRARKIVVRAAKPARARKLKPARSQRAQRQRANRRAGQLKHQAPPAAVVSRETSGDRSTPDNMTIASVGAKGADPLNVQVSVRFKLPAGMTPSANLVKQAI